MKILISDTNKKWLFHIFLWGSWLYLAISNASDAELYNRTIFITTLIVTTHIPLFLINSEWLIPKVLNKKGIPIYFASLLLLITVFTLLHGFVLDVVNSFLGLPERKGNHPLGAVVAIVMVAAISTGYGLLNYLVVQEKIYHEKQQERLKSELSFLRSQISPHFIFNILNSIVYLIRTKSDAAEPVTLKLSELMRYMLYESENAQIPLEKEISYLENYIELQKVRFEEDVQIEFRISDMELRETEMRNAKSEIKNTAGIAISDRFPEIRNPKSVIVMIEPMLLIPFVENAFKHGVGMVIHPIIDIDLKISKNALSFTVKNKIAPETALEKDESSGIGLKNVQRRLELLYPKKHQLTITNDGEWFEVKLNLTF